MQFKLLVAGSFCLVFPAVAQTVVLPSARNSSAATHEKATKDVVKESNVVNKMKDVNSIGETSGYDIVAFDTRNSSIRGTPFLVPTWAMGEVRMRAEKKPRSGVLKFDAYNQQVWALRPQGDSVILASEQIQEFAIRPTGLDGKPVERRFDRLSPELVPDMLLAFAEQISIGNEISLLKFQRKTIAKGSGNAGYSSSPASDAYESATQYFLRWNDGKCVPVKATKANILAVISQRYAQVAAAEMEEKTKMRTDAELGAMVQRMDKAIPSK